MRVEETWEIPLDACWPSTSREVEPPVQNSRHKGTSVLPLESADDVSVLIRPACESLCRPSQIEPLTFLEMYLLCSPFRSNISIITNYCPVGNRGTKNRCCFWWSSHNSLSACSVYFKLFKSSMKSSGDINLVDPTTTSVPVLTMTSLAARSSE